MWAFDPSIADRWKEALREAIVQWDVIFEWNLGNEACWIGAIDRALWVTGPLDGHESLRGVPFSMAKEEWYQWPETRSWLDVPISGLMP